MALKCWLKENKIEKKSVEFAPSVSFLDENGKPAKWKIKPLTSEQGETLREQCRTFNNKTKKFEFDSKMFNVKIATLCTVEPNLNDKELQDSYGVMCAEDLIKEMLDTDGEYQGYLQRCMEVSGFNIDTDELVEEVKN